MSRRMCHLRHPRAGRRCGDSGWCCGFTGSGSESCGWVCVRWLRSLGVSAALPGGRPKSVIYIFLSGGL
jgi:hypothetical protein